MTITGLLMVGFAFMGAMPVTGHHGASPNDIIPAPPGFIENCQARYFNTYTHWYTGEADSGFKLAIPGLWKGWLPLPVIGEQAYNGYKFQCTYFGGIGGGCGQECEVMPLLRELIIIKSKS